MMFVTWLGVAAAFEKRPVGVGDTVEAIAASLGDPSLADEIRARNGIAAGAQPAFGQVLTLPPPAGPHADQQTFLFSVTGEVTAAEPWGAPARVATFRALPIGSTICTAEASHAALRTASSCSDGAVEVDDVVLDENTCVVIESAFASVFGRSTLIRVTRGSITVAPTEGPDRVSVRTESGITTGASGGFRVHVERTAMRTEAVTGAVSVLGATRQLDLAARTGSRVPLGGDPTPAVDLLPPPDPRAPGAGDVLLRPRFAWSEVPEAFGYRMEIASNRLFTAVVYAETVDGPEHLAARLMLPETSTERWFWEVVAVDRLGFLGLPSPARPFTRP